MAKKKKKVEDDDEELSLIRSVAAKAIQEEDRFDIFGKYIVTKMRKLGKTLSDDAIDNIEFSITSLLMQSNNHIPKFGEVIGNFFPVLR